MALANNFTISGTGCALVDYLYKPIDFSGEVFKKHISGSPGDGGLSPGKLVFTEEFEKFSGLPYPQLRKEITEGRAPVGTNIGGPSIVSMIHVAQLLHDLPAKVFFSGCKGNDEAGKYIEEKLLGTPLKTAIYKTSKRFTPFTDVLSDPDYDSGHGERIFINNIGAAWDFLPSDLNDTFFDSQMVVFGGTALVPNIHNTLHLLLEKAKQRGAITVVNTVYDFINEKNNPHKPWPIGDSDRTWSFIDILIADKEEALRHSGCSSIDSALEFFREKGVGATIITHGPHPVSLYTNNELFGETAPMQLPVSQLVKQEIRENPTQAGDTTGCGDNFAGGVIAAVARQQILNPGTRASITKAVALGVASGGYACFYHGGTFFEKYPGEKKAKIQKYYDSYCLQTGLT